MIGLPLAFLYPWALLGLLTLPVIWYLLRLTPPKPRDEVFPPLIILQKLIRKEETPAKSPWWLTLLRLMLAGLAIIAMAAPVWNPRDTVLRQDGQLLLVIDDGWASGDIWPEMKRTALDIVGEARANNRILSILFTSDPTAENTAGLTADSAGALIEASANRSIRPVHDEAAAAIRNILSENPIEEVVYLSDGLDRNQESRALLSAIEAAGTEPTVILPDITNLVALGPVTNEPGKMTGEIRRGGNGASLPVRVTGYDSDGLPITNADALFADGDSETTFEFTPPVEIRNQIVRVALDRENTAGAVQLLDDSNRRRIVGLISGQSADISQPLLSPLYYIKRALAPYSDIREADTANIEEAASNLIEQGVSAIVMADVGRLAEATGDRLAEYISKGGTVIRFAGPRLATASDSPILPVELVEGDRFLGGALSWETPKSIAAFEPRSPFFGLETPRDVIVNRQVLAVQSRQLEERTWARLEDGTPLVTAEKRGAGLIVLIHVNSDNNWSNLPLSGSFVEMLRRTVNLSRSTAASAPGNEGLRLPPLEILDGRGNLVAPPPEIKPLVIEQSVTPQTGPDHPPGFYGTEDGFYALNLIDDRDQLEPLDLSTAAAPRVIQGYAGQQSTALKPWLLVAAAMLFLLDCIAVLWFAGFFKTLGGLRKPASATAGLFLALALPLAAFSGSLVTAERLSAQTIEIPTPTDAVTRDGVDFSAALVTRFAYVETGISQIDDVSRAGMLGLTRFVATRTALEPGQPIGVNIESDELSFYPFLYWPVTSEIPVPDAATMARVDAYMKQGGSVIFDTKNQFSGMLNNNAQSSESFKLRQILATLDIPPLEPVPPDHVLTKAFYLLDTFPGRYQGGDLWVERIATETEEETRPARAGDGVSTILITSNDFAGAWAIDDNNRALFPTVPPNPMQREYAFRTGVNLVMYTMTGNYKADQVHIPALLERLGQ